MEDLINLRELSAISLNPEFKEHEEHLIIKSEKGIEYYLHVKIEISKISKDKEEK